MTERIPADENASEVSTAFDLLSNARRRGVLYAVGRDGRATVEELAERIAAWQCDDGAVTVEEVRVSLVHSHLPMLADADVVDYDRSTDIVELTESAMDLEPYLRCADESLPSSRDASRVAGFAD